MKSQQIMVYLLAPRTLAATLLRDQTGIKIISSLAGVRPLLERIFLRPFDESLGFPPKRYKAKAGTLEALELGLSYLRMQTGFTSTLVNFNDGLFDPAVEESARGATSPPLNIVSSVNVPARRGETRLFFHVQSLTNGASQIRVHS